MVKVLVTGADGLVGSALRREVVYNPQYSWQFVNHQYGDLSKEGVVKDLFRHFRPDFVVHCAARVGGIGGNMAGQAQFFRDNILMNTHMIHHAWMSGVEKMLVFSSVCVFPDGIPVLTEDAMHWGEPFVGNFAYAYAKRMVDIQIRAYKDQYGDRNYCSVIPGNMFGPNDNFNLDIGHVVPALIHKLYLAKRDNNPFVVWGTGKALREFLWVGDVAGWIVELLGMEKVPERIIMSGEDQYSIKDIVDMLVAVAQFKGEVVWDDSKPDGQNKRPSDLTVLKNTVKDHEQTDLLPALLETWEWFCEHYPNVRT